MRKTICYLVHNLTLGTQKKCVGQKRLLKHLRGIGCGVDNNLLPQILLVPQTKAELENEDVGELYLIDEDMNEICVEELL